MPSERIAVTLVPLTNQHEQWLVGAAREVAAEAASARRLWWARTDYNLADARTFIAHSLTDRATGHGDAFVVRTHDGEDIGCVSAKNIDRLHGCFQGGYWLVPSARGKKLGQASLRALFDWGMSQGLVRMELHIGVDNAVSLAVAERIGAQLEGRMRSRFLLIDKRIDVNLMSVLAPGYEVTA